MSQSRGSYFASALAALFLIAACGGQPGAAPSAGATASGVAASAPKELKIGVVSSKSGTFFRQATLMQRGYDLIVKAVNDKGGVKIGADTYLLKLVYYDDKGEPNTATSIAERLITEDKVDFLLGPFSSGLTLPVGAIAEKYKKVFIGPGGNADALNQQGWKYYFGIGAKGSTLSNPFVDMLSQTRTPPKTFAIVSSDDLFGQGQREALKAFVRSKNMQVVYDDKYALTTTDYSTIIGLIKAANADVIIQIGDLKGCTTFVSQLQDLNVQPQAYDCAGPSMRDLSDNIKSKAAYVFGYGFGWDDSVPWCDSFIGCAKDYVALYKAAYNEDPSYQPVNASAAIAILLEGMKKAGSVQPDPVRDAIRANKITVGSGPIDYDETGQNTRGLAVIEQIQADGTVATVWPADRAKKTATYPVPRR